MPHSICLSVIVIARRKERRRRRRRREAKNHLRTTVTSKEEKLEATHEARGLSLGSGHYVITPHSFLVRRKKRERGEGESFHVLTIVLALHRKRRRKRNCGLPARAVNVLCCMRACTNCVWGHQSSSLSSCSSSFSSCCRPPPSPSPPLMQHLKKGVGLTGQEDVTNRGRPDQKRKGGRKGKGERKRRRKIEAIIVEVVLSGQFFREALAVDDD